METISFFTPIRYNEGKQKSFKQYVHEGVEDYFYLNGKSAYVIPGNLVNDSQKVKIKDTKQNKIKQIVLSAIKIVSYMTIIIPLIMLAAKAAFRMTHKFHQTPATPPTNSPETSVTPPGSSSRNSSTPPISLSERVVPIPQTVRSTPPKSEQQAEAEESASLLQQGITVNDDTISRIQNCMTSILKREKTEDITLYKSQGNHRVFSLDSIPGLVFKMKASNSVLTLGRNDSMAARYQTMINAKTVVRAHELGLLIIPNARLFSVNANDENYDIITEQKVDIDCDGSAQEKHFEEYGDSLNETIRQMTVFISKTGFSDVEWRNIPVINNSLDGNGNRKVALIDIEEMNSVETGLFGGGWGRRGLIGCVNGDQAKIVVEEAQKHTSVSEAERAIAHRKNEIAANKRLSAYHQKYSIVTGAEQIAVGKELDFSEFPKSDKLTQIATNLVAEINKMTLESSAQKSVKGRRYIYINTNHGSFQHLDNTRPDNTIHPHHYESQDAYDNSTYLGIVTKKLVELGHLYELIERNGHGYFMQA